MKLRNVILVLIAGSLALVLGALHRGPRPAGTGGNQPAQSTGILTAEGSTLVSCDIAGCCSSSVPDPQPQMARTAESDSSDESAEADVPAETQVSGFSASPGEAQVEVSEADQLLRRLREWASVDPERALESVLTLPEGADRDAALEAVCFGVAEKDPSAAVELAATLQLQDQPGVMDNLLQQWAAADLPSALEWARARATPGEQRDQLLARVAFVQSQVAPEQAARLVAEELADGEVRFEAMMMVLHQWANHDLIAAANWAQEFPVSLRNRAAAELENIAAYQATLKQ